MRGVQVCTCVFGCEHAPDKIEHYAVCAGLWDFFAQPMPRGLGLDRRFRSLHGFLMAERGMTRIEKLSMAIGVYAASRASAQYRGEGRNGNLRQLLLLHAREGLRGSRARRELAQAT